MVNARIWCSTALPEGLNTNAKLRDSTAASVSLNKNLLKIYQWVYQWKMILNPDVLKHTQKTVFSRKAIFFFSIWVIFHEHSRITGLQGKREGISLTSHHHFHPLRHYRHLDISQAITAEKSPLHIGSSRTRTGNLWFPSDMIICSR